MSTKTQLEKVHSSFIHNSQELGTIHVCQEINKFVYSYNEIVVLSKHRIKLLVHRIAWMNLINFISSEKSQTQKLCNVLLHLYEILE